MSDLPVPEPTAKDEELALAFIEVKDATNLRGKPEGEQQCDNCHFYANTDEDISYCWHPTLRILVDAGAPFMTNVPRRFPSWSVTETVTL